MPSRTGSSSLIVALGFIGFVASSCGGGGSSGSPPAPPPPPAPTITSVTVSPASASVEVGATQQFTATVQGTGSFSIAVNWFVNDVAGGNSTVGTISSGGLYTAPTAIPSPAQVTVKANSVQDTTKSGTANLTIRPPASTITAVTISPTQASLLLEETQQFTATVTGAGSFNPGVNWFVNDYQGGNSWHGTISASGSYKAPMLMPDPCPQVVMGGCQVTLKAVSQADGTKSATATVTLSIPPGAIASIDVSPTVVTLQTNETQRFTNTMSGARPQNVRGVVQWFVEDVDGGNSMLGTVSYQPGTGGNATYTAPAIVPQPPSCRQVQDGCQVTVKVVSEEDPTKSATSLVTITPDLPKPRIMNSRFINESVSDFLLSVQVDADNNIYAAGVKSDASGTIPFGVVKAFRPDLTDLWSGSYAIQSFIGMDSLVYRESDRYLVFTGERLDTRALWLGRVDAVSGSMISDQSCQLPEGASSGLVLRAADDKLVIGVSSPVGSQLVTVADPPGTLSCDGALTVQDGGFPRGLWLTKDGGFLVSSVISCAGGINDCSVLRKLGGAAPWPTEKVFPEIVFMRVIEQVEDGQSFYYVAGTDIRNPVWQKIYIQKLNPDGAEVWPEPIRATNRFSSCAGQDSNELQGLIPSPAAGVTAIVDWRDGCGTWDAGALIVYPGGTLRTQLGGMGSSGFTASAGTYNKTGDRLVLVGGQLLYFGVPSDFTLIVYEMPVP